MDESPPPPPPPNIFIEVDQRSITTLIDCESTETVIDPLVDNILTAPINSVNKENILAYGL